MNILRTATVLVALIGLGGCEVSPHPTFLGARTLQATVDGRQFTVFQKANKAEVVRLGWATMEQREGMGLLMIAAAEQATGCTVNPASFEGDDGEARMSLRCPK